MLTRDEILSANYFHYGECTRTVGPRGGVKTYITNVRRNGRTRLWKRSPNRFTIPIKHGLREHGYINDLNSHLFHTEESCPLRQG